jgi:dipeptidyl aminopeptidase/acylaminoacyl peptidase
LLTSAFGEWDARFSPDGRWISYTSDESSEKEIYLRRVGATETRSWKISSGGGAFARWGSSGEELFYLNNNHTLTLASLRFDGDAVRVVESRAMFPMPPFLEDFDVSRDGTAIVMTRYLEVRRSNPVTIVTNWMSGLRKD